MFRIGSIRIIGAAEHQSEHNVGVVDGASVVPRDGNGNAGPSSAREASSLETEARATAGNPRTRDIIVRQAAMAVKCMLLVCYKDSRGRDYLKQGQMLTLFEYLLLLYRALLPTPVLPTPVWYRFFLKMEYGSFFPSLITGLYLAFKLTSIVERAQCFFVALRALSRKEVHYVSYATSEQVNAVGDLCAICQGKMHAPIRLSCKHIFCKDCVSERFKRERTCPLCRALVKPPGIRSYGDGSTCLFFQLF